jgi:hypothetical protein
MSDSYLDKFRKFPVEKPAELERILVRTYTDIANAANVKENSQYELYETVNCQQFYQNPAIATPENIQNKRFVYRICVETGEIPTATIVNIPHGIAQFTDMVNIYGTVEVETAPGIYDWRPIPFVGPWGTDLLSVWVDAVNIHIESGQTFPTIISGRVILEYFKN